MTEARLAALPRHPVVTGVVARLRPVRHLLGIVTPFGWSLVAGAVLLLIAGTALGWQELRIGGLALVALVVLAALTTLGGSIPELSVGLAPTRLTPRRTPGQPAPRSEIHVRVHNPTTRRLRPVVVEFPIGEQARVDAVPSLGAGEDFVITDSVVGERRGVVVVGPMTTVRGDPLGIARRIVSRTPEVELFVHPQVFPLPALDAGLVRDLEGRPTTDPSDSDLDFHTLREYAAGDEQRHIHWLSSARATAAAGTAVLLTKTYTDTRRSHLGIVVDGRPSSYSGSEEAFEVALAAAASVAARAFVDEMDVTVVAAEEAMDRADRLHTLDGFARVNPADHDLSVLTGRLIALAATTSIVLLVTGSDNPFAELRRAGALLPPHVRVLALRVHLGERSRTATLSDVTVLSLGDPDDLARLIAAGRLS